MLPRPGSFESLTFISFPPPTPTPSLLPFLVSLGPFPSPCPLTCGDQSGVAWYQGGADFPCSGHAHLWSSCPRKCCIIYLKYFLIPTTFQKCVPKLTEGMIRYLKMFVKSGMKRYVSLVQKKLEICVQRGLQEVHEMHIMQNCMDFKFLHQGLSFDSFLQKCLKCLPLRCSGSEQVATFNVICPLAVCSYLKANARCVLSCLHISL